MQLCSGCGRVGQVSPYGLCGVDGFIAYMRMLSGKIDCWSWSVDAADAKKAEGASI